MKSFNRNLRILKGTIGKEQAKLCGLPGASKSFLLGKLIPSTFKKVVFISPTEQTARAIAEDSSNFGLNSLYLPSWDVPPLDIASPSKAIQHKRFSTLYSILDKGFDVLSTTPRALMQKVLSPDEVILYSLEIAKGQDINYGRLLQTLTTFGFKRVDYDPDECEFLLRNNSLKLSLPDGKTLSADIYDNRVKSCKINDREIEGTVVVPCLEMPLDIKRLSSLRKRYSKVLEKHVNFGEGEKLLPKVYDLSPVRDYIGNVTSITYEPYQCERIATEFKNTVIKNYELLRERGIPSAEPGDFLVDYNAKSNILIYEESVKDSINFKVNPMPLINEDNIEDIIKTLKKTNVTFIYQSEDLAKKVQGLKSDVKTLKGISTGGFRIGNSAYIAESGINLEGNKDNGITSFEPGMLVVHKDYGIGIFRGISGKVLNGKRFDFVKIEYANSENLYVPFTQMDRIYRYTGYIGKSPRIDKLGSRSWKNLKRNIKESIVKFAAELAKIYSERKASKGERLIGNSQSIENFEKAFPYAETPDQGKAIRDVYRDMESEKPMDRLICGDVGFGKTEVAMRAAMKAVSSGKQVAVIAPTTILVDQHLSTFQNRFKEFPVRIGSISRFNTKGEQRQILDDLRNGRIDIIIGTHRLTQNDVGFKDLGLLIVDEEHRFGVKAKEKITRLKANLDVLYLSATPIPRTLYASLSGFKDISIIETPPPARRGVKTVISNYTDDLLKTAVDTELKRNGQVFIVQNDVNELSFLTERLKRIYNEPVEMVHGKMNSDQIENIMHDFFEGRTRILVATSIVESGLDVPSANTLIVIGAENFGLSQLYQLKGRVGRGSQKGYCYLLVSQNAKLSDKAIKRLEAIKKTSALGGGFKLAMEDLEIRGAGTFLGPKQSGYIKSLGFDLYANMFEEIVNNKVERETTINIPIEAFIPKDYIGNETERLKVYTEIVKSNNRDLRERIEKLYGKLPNPVINIFKLTKLKSIAERIGILDITLAEDTFIVSFDKNAKIQVDRLLNLIKEGKVNFTPELKLYVKTKSIDDLIPFLEALEGESGHRKLIYSGSQA